MKYSTKLSCTNNSEMQIKSIVCLKSTFLCIDVTVYRTRVPSVIKKTTSWSSGYASDSDEVVIFNTGARAPSERASESIFFI